MPRREITLLAQIEKDVLNDNVPLATALRKCIVLGGKSGSERLRDWATRELQGYFGQEDLPDYRVIGAPLQLDGFSGNYRITGEQLPPSVLPDFAQEHISEEVQLRDGVGALEALGQREEIKLMPKLGADLVRVMNGESDDPYRRIDRIYWNVSPSAIHGVLDYIRTALAQLVAELQAAVSGDDEVPSTEAADQAVNVVVTGKRSRVNVTTAHSSGPSGLAVATTKPEDDSPWTRSRRVGAFIAGLATVVGAVAAVWQLT